MLQSYQDAKYETSFDEVYVQNQCRALDFTLFVAA